VHPAWKLRAGMKSTQIIEREKAFKVKKIRFTASSDFDTKCLVVEIRKARR
jgi:hypothetical protein